MVNEITVAEIANYNNYMRRIGRGAADERQADGSYGEDGIEKYVDDLAFKAATLGLKFVVSQESQEWVLMAMTEQEIKDFQAVQQEIRARDAIIAWAKVYWTPRYDEDEDGKVEYGDPPQVEVLDPAHRNDDDTWTMQLWIDRIEDSRATVTFRLNEDSTRVDPIRIEYPARSVFFEYAQASVWHQERKTAEWTEYYVLLKDGDKTVSTILKYNHANKEIRSDIFIPVDHDYTVHDACDHAGEHGEEYCCLEDPESEEYQEEIMANKLAMALRALEKQVKQAKIAEELRADKSKVGDHFEVPGPSDVG